MGTNKQPSSHREAQWDVALRCVPFQFAGVPHHCPFDSPRDYLEHITAIGPRTTGSAENEILTVQYLLKQIRLIEAQSQSIHRISVDIQRPTGSFSIDFLGGFTSYYDNITNIVVKLEPRGGAQHAVLANCHFDSVANSPGMYLIFSHLKSLQSRKFTNVAPTCLSSCRDHFS